MSDLRAYVPGQTGTLADVVEQGPDLKPVRPAGPDGFKPTPTFGELFQAAKPEAVRATPGYDDVKTSEGYAPIVDALGLPDSENPVHFPDFEGRDRYSLFLPGSPSNLAAASNVGGTVPFSRTRTADRGLQESLIAGQIRQRRLKDPSFLAGIPDTVEGLHDYFEQQQAQKRAAGARVLARGSTLGTAVAGLAAGGVESAAHDPAFIPTLVIGGGTASSVLQAVGRDALINGILTASQLPAEAHNMAENDEHLTVGQAVGQVVGGAVVGGAFGGTVHLAGEHVPPALFKVLPESVQNRWASRMKVGDVRLGDLLGDMDNRELAGFARSTLGDRITPDEKASADVLERSQEVGEASPFEPGAAGDSAHNANLADTIKSIVDGVPRDTRAPFLSSTSLTAPSLARHPISAGDLGSASVPHDIVDFFKSKGLDDAHAYGIAAGIAAESRGGDHTAVNPKSGALGLGQWLGSRKAALLERYGPNPSRAQQLEFLWHELTGGDPGGRFVLEAKETGQVLDAYIRKFMRPAAGAETLGDLDRGMAALGRKGEIPEGAPIGAGDEDAIAALGREADAAEREAIDLSSSRDANAELGRPHELEAADYPILKRQLFANDRDWFEAQLGFYQSQGLLSEAAAEAAGRPLRAEIDRLGPEASEGPAGAPGASDEPYSLIPPHDREYDFAFQLPRSRLEEIVKTGPREADVDEGVVTQELASELLREHLDYGQFKSDNLVDVVRRTLIEQRDRGWIDRVKAGRGHTGEQAAFIRLGSALGELRERGEFPALREKLLRNLQDRSWTRADAEEVLDYRLADLEASGRLKLDAPPPVAVRVDDPALKAFEAAGGAKDQLQSLEHDFRTTAEDPELSKRIYHLDDGGKPRTIAEIFDEIESDRAAAAALRACSGLGA